MEPHNQNALSVWSWCVQEEQGAEEAYKIIRREVVGIGCTMENELLFERARLLAQHLEKAEDLKWIESQLEAFSDALEKAELYNDLYDDFAQPIQQPIVKEKKCIQMILVHVAVEKNIRNAVEGKSKGELP